MKFLFYLRILVFLNFFHRLVGEQQQVFLPEKEVNQYFSSRPAPEIVNPIIDEESETIPIAKDSHHYMFRNPIEERKFYPSFAVGEINPNTMPRNVPPMEMPIKPKFDFHNLLELFMDKIQYKLQNEEEPAFANAEPGIEIDSMMTYSSSPPLMNPTDESIITISIVDETQPKRFNRRPVIEKVLQICKNDYQELCFPFIQKTMEHIQVDNPKEMQRINWKKSTQCMIQMKEMKKLSPECDDAIQNMRRYKKEMKRLHQVKSFPYEGKDHYAQKYNVQHVDPEKSDEINSFKKLRRHHDLKDDDENIDSSSSDDNPPCMKRFFCHVGFFHVFILIALVIIIMKLYMRRNTSPSSRDYPNIMRPMNFDTSNVVPSAPMGHPTYAPPKYAPLNQVDE